METYARSVQQRGLAGHSVSAIGLGLAALGRPGYLTLGHGDDLDGAIDPEALERRAHAVLDLAWARGITYFDAARSYGRAEAFLASWLAAREIEPPAVTVGSKWGYVYRADWQVDAPVHEEKIHTIDNLERQLVESDTILGRYLDLYQIHSATIESGVLSDPAVIGRLSRLRDDRVIVGFTTSGPGQTETIERALEVEVDSLPLFGAVQSTWNLLEPSAGSALAAASEAGLAVIVKEALANGRLTPRNSDLASSMGSSLGGFPLDAVALAAAIAQPWATVVLSGAVNEGQLTSNLEALDVPIAVVAGLPSVSESTTGYWSIRAGLAWQ
jgi:aryl-alcohol dehydrogenase-like predicted oxidoreductase